MTPYYYKIQRIVDSISGEVLSQEVLDTVQRRHRGTYLFKS